VWYKNLIDQEKVNAESIISNYVFNYMFILGINGWGNRSHDASACLIENGKLISMVEEERFLRQKHAYDALPINSTTFCLNNSKIGLDKIDFVAIGWDLPKHYQSRGLNFPKTNKKIVKHLFPKNQFKYKKYPKVIFVPHHLAHAASSFFTSGFKDAAILVADGQGEKQSTSLFRAKNNKIKLIKEFPIKDSLGYFFEAACKMVGLKTEDGGKIMGLASYGKTKIFNFDFIKLLPNGYSLGLKKDLLIKKNVDEQEEIIKQWFKLWKNQFNITPEPPKYYFNNKLIKREIDFNNKNKNFAASTQKSLEKIILHLAKILKEKSGSKNIILSGGVALNCSSNGNILDSKIFKNMYIFPASTDSGVSLGAALYVDSIKNRNRKYKRIKSPYLGPAFSNKKIKKVLDKNKIKYRFYKNISRKVAKLLTQDKIVGWFQGKMEIGPRALGNRSILADPRYKKNHKIVNKIKGRENWRPLAPSILSSHKNNYFEKNINSPFMLLAIKTNKKAEKEIPAVIHIDNTTRFQSVDNTNKKYYNLIKEFYKMTRVPVVLNTSFNLNNEPIVCTPEDAIKTFYSSPLDCLAIGNFIINKLYEKRNR